MQLTKFQQEKECEKYGYNFALETVVKHNNINQGLSGHGLSLLEGFETLQLQRD